MATAKMVKVRHNAILFTINRTYRCGMTSLERYEATRGIWAVGPPRNKADYAMAVYRGIVKEVYCIDQWHPAGTLEYQTLDASGYKNSGKWEVSGSVAQEIRDEYIGFSLGKGVQKGFRYANA